jgi:hypothetical protein
MGDARRLVGRVFQLIAQAHQFDPLRIWGALDPKSAVVTLVPSALLLSSVTLGQFDRNPEQAHVKRRDPPLSATGRDLPPTRYRAWPMTDSPNTTNLRGFPPWPGVFLNIEQEVTAMSKSHSRRAVPAGMKELPTEYQVISKPRWYQVVFSIFLTDPAPSVERAEV